MEACRMTFFLAKTLVILLFFIGTACSISSQKGSLKTDNERRAEPSDKRVDLPPEGRTFGSKEGDSPSSSGVGPKAGRSHLAEQESLLKRAQESFQRSQDLWQKGDSQSAIAALDEAYNRILQVNPDGELDLAREKEKIRLLICKRMLEIYASQHTTAKGSEKDIPLALNRYVEREINLFKGSERKFFVEGYKRSGKYRPMILAALERAGLPKELSWLPLIESGFNEKAFSRARALGLWQFIPSTGYKFGLTRDHWRDERMDVQKSTQAAIAYLRELHDIFGDWYTVLAAYNCGEARVLKVIRTQKINYLDNFWDLFEKLPQETARYVPRFIATLLIINDPGRFGFNLGEPHPSIPFEKVKISRQMSLKDVAKILTVSSETVETLNPELRLKVMPPGTYELRVPEGTGDLLLAKLKENPASPISPKPHVLHQVQPGETLGQLAARYRTSVQAIADLNQLKDKDILKVGQKLRIPAAGSAAANQPGK